MRARILGTTGVFISALVAGACGGGTTTTVETVDTDLAPASGYETPVYAPPPAGEIEVETDSEVEIEYDDGEIEIEHD